MRDSMASRWFVAREDGMATRDDVVGTEFAARILANEHAPDSMTPFSVRDERLRDPPITAIPQYRV